MNEIEILRDGVVFVKVKPDGSSTHYKKIMSDNELRLSFTLAHYAPFKINDYCNVFRETFKVNKLPTVTERGKYTWDYVLNMQYLGYDLSKVLFLFLGFDNTLRETTFAHMDTPDGFLGLIVDNMNRADSGWTKGQAIPAAPKNLKFSGVTCYNALAQIATAFETEFAIEGKRIHLTARSQDTGLTLKHGKANGLYSTTRQTIEKDIITRLYAVGSTKNLPAGYRNGADRLKMPGVDYLELHVGEYGAIEGVAIFEDIFPRRTGKVTSIDPANVFKFRDTTIDFDLNAYKLDGVLPKVTFNNGQLAGFTLEVGSYNHTLKEFTLLKKQEELAFDIPSEEFHPAIGNAYVLTDVSMPPQYVAAAELEVKNKALEVLRDQSEPQVRYSVIPDPVVLRLRKIIINTSDLVWVVDTRFQLRRQIRIIGFTRNVVNEYEYAVELADSVTLGTITLIERTALQQGNQIGLLNQQVNVLAEKNFGDLPTITDTTGYSQIFINNATGQIVKKV